MTKTNATDFDHLRRRWVDYLVGNNHDIESPAVQAVISSLDFIADERTSYQPELSFNPVYCAPHYTIHALAKAYKTPGSKYYGDPQTRTFIFNELERFYQDTYNLDTSFDNWWAVEVGQPKQILDILILLYDELEDREALITKHTDVILHFQSAYAKAARGGIETGANLAWKCRVLFLTGILRKEQQWLDWVNEQIPTMLRYSHELPTNSLGTTYDDGFYPDGSFIQHYAFSYTGGYGKNLITTLGGLFYAFMDTGAMSIPEKNMAFLWKMIFAAYEPLIYRGRFFDIARGREPSRYFHQDYMAGRHTIRGLCYLAAVMPPALKKRAYAMIKEWLLADTDRFALLRDEDGRAEHFVYGSIVPILREILADTTPSRGPLVLHKTFGVSANVVHLTEEFGLALKMYSPSIACYEYLSGEGRKFWHMSDGVTYLYTADINGYNQDFYATVDMQRLPGTTVDRSPMRTQDEYYSWYISEARNVYAFAGGTDMDERNGIAGMQYRGQGLGKVRDLEVKKSWFMFGNEILCMGSGITSSTGHPIETIVENRRLLSLAENSLTINDGKTIQCQQVGSKQVQPTTLHLSGNKGSLSDIGYYFPAGGEVHILCEHRIGTWNCTEVIPEHRKENDFATIYFPHGDKPRDAGYAYVLLPGITASETWKYAQQPSIEIVENTPEAHAAKHLHQNIIGVNFWNCAPYISADISSSGQCSVMMRQMGTQLEIALSDPTKSESEVVLSFPVDVVSVSSCDDQIRIENLSPLTIRFDSRNTHRGTVCLRAIAIPNQ